MPELTDRDFPDLCADDGVRRLIDDANRHGAAAARNFWLILILGLAIIGASTFIAIDMGYLITGVLVGSIGTIAVYCIAIVPLVHGGRRLKLDVLDILARQNNMTYAALTLAPPVYPEARAVLFGETLTTESFTDLFEGRDAEGRRFATCQAYLLFENGGSFNGRFFSFDRAAAGDQATGHEARIPPDLGRPEKIRLYTGPNAILVAIEGRKGFTPGLGFRFRRGEERVRSMFDDLADSLAILSRLKASLDPVL